MKYLINSADFTKFDYRAVVKGHMRLTHRIQ
ncbi:hypothetical protein SIXOD_v1c09500 [Spiroplasma ixodetis Y32]|nr:hypothetical protein SIXOD_v1c09500 [Spiroplasma ixodetis Y32]